MADRIELSSFSLQYSATTPRVLSSISFGISGGSCCGILGPTGAGKTSLLHCLAGTMRRHHPEAVTAGAVSIGDRSFQGLPAEILFPRVGLVLQDPHVQISGVRDTVLGEILFTLENIGVCSDASTDSIVRLLRDLGIGHLAGRKPTTLSGGETQRVALATILIANPPVLLLDEPTTALDMSAQEKLRSILRSMHGTTTIVLTDTQFDFALGICDQIVIMDRGIVVFDGPPASFVGSMDKFKELLPMEDWASMKSELEGLLEESSQKKTRIGKALGIS
jgi:energy-coupling factor transport system ATP-binding protein